MSRMYLGFFALALCSVGLVWVSYSSLFPKMSAPVFNLTKYKCFQCVKRVAFIKVHKAASTTMTSILQRFGVSHNLTFALPKRDMLHIGFLETFRPENVFPVRDGAVYDILCQHVIYNREAFRKYLPPDIRVIAAVRDPLDRFVSSFQYFYTYGQRIRNMTGKSDDVELMREYLKSPGRFEFHGLREGSLLLNRMSFDLGVPGAHFTDTSFVKDYVKMLDEDMVLVLVTEYFDESLVILKRKLCWSMKDILYEIQHGGNPVKPHIPDDVRERLYSLSLSEYQIYYYFKEKFLKTAAIEKDLSEEVSAFRKINRKTLQYCKSNTDGSLLVPSGKFSEAFTVSKTDCLYIGLDELEFVKRLIRHQVQGIPVTLPLQE